MRLLTNFREYIQAPHLARAEPKKQEIVEFTGDESELMKNFLQDQRQQIADNPRNTTTDYLDNLRRQVNASQQHDRPSANTAHFFFFLCVVGFCRFIYKKISLCGPSKIVANKGVADVFW